MVTHLHKDFACAGNASDGALAFGFKLLGHFRFSPAELEHDVDRAVSDRDFFYQTE